jgi:hypothetical protein
MKGQCRGISLDSCGIAITIVLEDSDMPAILGSRWRFFFYPMKEMNPSMILPNGDAEPNIGLI